MLKQRMNIADDGDLPVNTQAAALAERLRWLPVDGSDPTAVPAPLAQVLTPVRRYVHAQPTHTPINRVEYELLGALALSGWSMRAALTEAVNWRRGLDPRSGVFKQAWAHLQHAGLWDCELVRVSGRSVALVRLTDSGREHLAAVGLTACASEWDTILARHSGDAARSRRTPPPSSCSCTTPAASTTWPRRAPCSRRWGGRNPMCASSTAASRSTSRCRAAGARSGAGCRSGRTRSPSRATSPCAPSRRARPNAWRSRRSAPASAAARPPI